METKVLLVGFGNIGKSVFESIRLSPEYCDIEVVGIVTRRKEEVAKQIPAANVFGLDEISRYSDCPADVAVMCGGSRNDLPAQTPFFAKYFNVVDSFDMHAHIGPYIDEETVQPMLGHLEAVNLVCLASGHVGCIGVGWDPGSFSMMRGIFSACLGKRDKVHAFYGLTEGGGLSMGHTNAIKKISGVADALQFTHAKLEAIERIRRGEYPSLSDGDKHWRECLVLLKPGADKESVEKAILNMPIYFAPYKTTVKFVSPEEIYQRKENQSHDGLVIVHGAAGCMEFKNTWRSNPEGTAGFLLAFSRAVHRAYSAGRHGCFTVLDFSVADLLFDPRKKIDLV